CHQHSNWPQLTF
nr:immunoglobulin light chain junction region [Macaca mulatta]